MTLPAYAPWLDDVEPPVALEPETSEARTERLLEEAHDVGCNRKGVEMSKPTFEQAQADIAFLLLRCSAAGSVSFMDDRWTGMSSNALVKVAYGGEQDALPHDRSDYAACVRTYARLPRHRRTPAVRKALKDAREFYLQRYPEDRFPEPRNAAREQRQLDREQWRKRKNVRRRRSHPHPGAHP